MVWKFFLWREVKRVINILIKYFTKKEFFEIMKTLLYLLEISFMKIWKDFALHVGRIRILSSASHSCNRPRRSRSEVKEREREGGLRFRYTQSRSIVCLSAWRAPSLHHLTWEATLFIVLRRVKLAYYRGNNRIPSNRVEIFRILLSFQSVLSGAALLRKLFSNYAKNWQKWLYSLVGTKIFS